MTKDHLCVFSHSFFRLDNMSCGVGVDSWNSRPHHHSHQRNTSAYTDPTPHYHFVKDQSEEDLGPVRVLEEVARCHGRLNSDIQLLTTMARLLEGKAAAITGGVTGTVQPTICNMEELLITTHRHWPRHRSRICSSRRQHWSQLFSGRQISCTVRKSRCRSWRCR